ncbi:MAG: RNA pyrophosphohydrolase [Gammaproteobacteria bacterium]|nr:RNA pyrophosphohydrolase [Gammaproteobacteria bacterium]
MKDGVYENGYRLNVCIVLCNRTGHVFFAQRNDASRGWQFPQGGIQHGESTQQAMFRELQEEVGLKRHHVRVIARTARWFRYRLPSNRIPPDMPVVGQKQQWFLVQMTAPDHMIDLRAEQDDAEFRYWEWVDFKEPLRRIVRFKRRVYRDALESLAPYMGLEDA